MKIITSLDISKTDENRYLSGFRENLGKPLWEIFRYVKDLQTGWIHWPHFSYCFSCGTYKPAKPYLKKMVSNMNEAFEFTGMLKDLELENDTVVVNYCVVSLHTSVLIKGSMN